MFCIYLNRAPVVVDDISAFTHRNFGSCVPFSIYLYIICCLARSLLMFPNYLLVGILLIIRICVVLDGTDYNYHIFNLCCVAQNCDQR